MKRITIGILVAAYLYHPLWIAIRNEVPHQFFSILAWATDVSDFMTWTLYSLINACYLLLFLIPVLIGSRKYGLHPWAKGIASVLACSLGGALMGFSQGYSTPGKGAVTGLLCGCIFSALAFLRFKTAENKESPTIGSSVFLTRGTPLAGQESRRGSKSAEP